ncbi:MAG TPA: hypothetical protein VI564_04285 [Candidatus Nanoarchaeia archaeon]|nr:hypothetical protein [Candidatus Nanoarchaeia archaeon]
MKRFLPIALIILIFVPGCKSNAGMTEQEKVQYSLKNCERDNKICPDGSIVMRIGPDCEFEACPEMNDPCGYSDFRKDYSSRNPEECKRMKFTCYGYETMFSNECGCGCQKPEWMTGGTMCQEGDRYYERCPEDEETICGIIDPKSKMCGSEPCKKEFKNRCEACRTENIVYAAVGKC